MDGLSEFKQDLDLIVTNCKKFWSVELDMYQRRDPGLPNLADQEFKAGQEEAQEFVTYANDFQVHVNQKYAEILREIQVV